MPEDALRTEHYHARRPPLTRDNGRSMIAFSSRKDKSTDGHFRQTAEDRDGQRQAKRRGRARSGRRIIAAGAVLGPALVPPAGQAAEARPEGSLRLRPEPRRH